MALVVHSRAPHWQDESGNPGQTSPRRRRIQNHSNRQRSVNDHEMIPTTQDLEDDPRQVGPVVFQWSNKAALDCYGGSTNVPGEAGIAALQHPPTGHWLIYRPIGLPNIAATKLASKRAVELDGIYHASTKLYWVAMPNGLAQLVRVANNQAPTAYDLEVYPSGGTISVADNQMIVKRPNGKEVIRMRAPYAWDSSDGGNSAGPGPETRIIRCYLSDEGAVSRWGYSGRLLRTTVETADVPGSTFPIWIG